MDPRFEETVEDQEQMSKVLRTSQIIVVALLTGIMIFLGIAIFKVSENPPILAGPPIVTYVCFGFLFLETIAWLIVPGVVGKELVRRIAQNQFPPTKSGEQFSDLHSLALAHQTVTIIAAALVEGGAFFTIIAFLIEGQNTALIATGYTILLLLLTFPTRVKLRSWIELNYQRLQQIRGDSEE